MDDFPRGTRGAAAWSLAATGAFFLAGILQAAPARAQQSSAASLLRPRPLASAPAVANASAPASADATSSQGRASWQASRAASLAPSRFAADFGEAARPQSPTRSPRPAPRASSPSFTAQRLLEQAGQHVAAAEAALRRHAPFSARDSANEALRLVAEAKDYAGRGNQAATDWKDALAAIRESGDLMGRYGTADPASLQRMVEAHHTAVLKGRDLRHFSAAQASDLYLDMARQKLAKLAAGQPQANRALLVLARLYRQEGSLEPHADAVAINLLRAAYQTAPQEAGVANELGYLLMKQGILGEAQWAFQQSLAIAPSAAATRNLAEVLHQQGHREAAHAVLAQWPSAAASAPVPSPPPVVQLDPVQFAAVSRPQQAFSTARGLPPNASSRGAPVASPAPGPERATPPISPPQAAGMQPPVASPISPVGRVAKAFSAWFQ